MGLYRADDRTGRSSPCVHRHRPTQCLPLPKQEPPGESLTLRDVQEQPAGERALLRGPVLSPADSSSLLHSDRSPLRAVLAVVDAASERSASALSNAVLTSIQKPSSGEWLASKSEPGSAELCADPLTPYPLVDGESLADGEPLAEPTQLHSTLSCLIPAVLYRDTLVGTHLAASISKAEPRQY